MKIGDVIITNDGIKSTIVEFMFDSIIVSNKLGPLLILHKGDFKTIKEIRHEKIKLLLNNHFE